MAKSEKEKKNVIVGFNPSARNQLELDAEELDYIGRMIREAGIKLAKTEDEALMIVLMGLIRKNLREDPTFARKLRELLGLDEYFKGMRSKPQYPKKSKKMKRIRKIRVGTDYWEYRKKKAKK